jgi:hypothetical protein
MERIARSRKDSMACREPDAREFPTSVLREALREGIDHFGVNLVTDALAGECATHSKESANIAARSPAATRNGSGVSVPRDSAARVRSRGAYCMDPSPNVSLVDPRTALQATLALIQAHMTPRGVHGAVAAEERVSGLSAVSVVSAALLTSTVPEIGNG